METRNLCLDHSSVKPEHCAIACCIPLLKFWPTISLREAIENLILFHLVAKISTVQKRGTDTKNILGIPGRTSFICHFVFTCSHWTNYRHLDIQSFLVFKWRGYKVTVYSNTILLWIGYNYFLIQQSVKTESFSQIFHLMHC